MAYTINNTAGATVTTITDGTLDTTTSLQLVGKNYEGFGEPINENFVKLLESNASASAPSAPLTGQLWYDTTNKVLKIYGGTAFKNLGSAQISTSAPTTSSQGDFWYDSDDKQLYIADDSSATWKLIGPVWNNTAGKSGFEVEGVATSGGGTTYITKLFDSGTLVAIVSNSSFTPSTAITGFTSPIAQGITLSSDIGSNKFRGTATNSEQLSGVAASNYLRADESDTINGSLTVDSDSGVIVGEDQDFTIAVVDQNVELKNSTADTDITFKVNDGGSITEVIRIDGSTSQVGIGTTAPETKLHVSGTTKFAGNSQVTGNLTVDGNLSVTGTQTSTNTATLNVSDQFIKVADGNSGAVLSFGGVEFDRGDTSSNKNAYWVWDEANDRWSARLSDDDLSTSTLTDIGADTAYVTATSAQYADLAEKYTSDEQYEPGTVVSFGGSKEVTVSAYANDTAVAGVVSTNPAYLMNSESDGVAVALVGKVLCKVHGIISKGDLLTTSGEYAGHARKAEDPKLGSIIGKAMESHNEAGTGQIFVSVGKL